LLVQKASWTSKKTPRAAAAPPPLLSVGGEPTRGSPPCAIFRRRPDQLLPSRQRRLGPRPVSTGRAKRVAGSRGPSNPARFQSGGPTVRLLGARPPTRHTAPLKILRAGSNRSFWKTPVYIPGPVRPVLNACHWHAGPRYRQKIVLETPHGSQSQNIAKIFLRGMGFSRSLRSAVREGLRPVAEGGTRRPMADGGEPREGSLVLKPGILPDRRTAP